LTIKEDKQKIIEIKCAGRETLGEKENVMPPTKPIGLMTKGWLDDSMVEQEFKDQWINNGFAILRNVYTSTEIDQYNQIVAMVRTQVDDGKDEHGYGDRIGQLHQQYPRASQSCP
jgi:hypothetical protein